ncbi:TYRO protein tyrosine kinase-binding protein-like [Mustelus asterias]
MLDSVSGQNGCEDCYRIDGGVLAGIVIGDVIMTVMIAMTMYYFARRSVKHSNAGIEVQIPRNKSRLDTESPYEELQLSQRGLYMETGIWLEIRLFLWDSIVWGWRFL